MLLLDYQNVLIESLLKDRFSRCVEVPRSHAPMLPCSPVQ